MTALYLEVNKIIEENSRRIAVNNAPFNPYSGEGAVGERVEVTIDDFPIKVQWLPVEMLKVPLITNVIAAGSVRSYLTDILKVPYSEEDRLKVIEAFVRVRNKYDFCFWAASYVYIKNKGGGEDGE